MKALILAAGLGTRLAPYTDRLPKPLFTLNNRTVLDLAIDRLIQAGCTKIFINTHHLEGQIRSRLDRHPNRQMLTLVHEPEILDTGGAVANLKNELEDDDFLVVNADVVHDLDLKPVIARHREEKALATLVLHDHPEFNKVTMGPDNTIRNFTAAPGAGLAFTGLQVVSPELLNHLPQKKAFSSIEVYASLCHSGSIKGYQAHHFFWQDMGTVQRYQETARQFLAGTVFKLPPARFHEMEIQPLAGDGSDRNWFRAAYQGQQLVLSDHGICLDPSDSLRQLTAFVRIGTHLAAREACVPAILGHDQVSGQVAVQDLGTTHLADVTAGLSETALASLYRKVIDRLIAFSQTGVEGFNTDWTCQTPTYSKKMILDLECRYFLDAFVKGYCRADASWQELEPAFSHIADQASARDDDGLMHRDFQSRNIMIMGEKIFFIDFQSARIGPLAYDLASLLIDPYVTLPQRVQDNLVSYCIGRLAASGPGFDEADFRRRYTYCALARNLQMLGAFGFLTRVKGKPWFESYIPAALAGLKQRLAPLDPCAPLFTLVTTL